MSDQPGFWRRQFLVPPTSAQTVWDVLSGILLPMGCLAGDRILFGRGFLGLHGHYLLGDSIFNDYAIAVYGFVLTEVVLMGTWLLVRRRLGRSAAFFAGPFLAGWIFAFFAGVLLLPLSVFGLVFLVGILGFSPWLTFFAFFRNWKLARLLSREHLGVWKSRWLALAGIVFALTPGLVLDRLARDANHSPGRLAETPFRVFESGQR